MRSESPRTLALTRLSPSNNLARPSGWAFFRPVQVSARHRSHTWLTWYCLTADWPSTSDLHEPTTMDRSWPRQCQNVRRDRPARKSTHQNALCWLRSPSGGVKVTPENRRNSSFDTPSAECSLTCPRSPPADSQLSSAPHRFARPVHQPGRGARRSAPMLNVSACAVLAETAPPGLAR